MENRQLSQFFKQDVDFNVARISKGRTVLSLMKWLNEDYGELLGQKAVALPSKDIKPSK